MPFQQEKQIDRNHPWWKLLNNFLKYDEGPKGNHGRKKKKQLKEVRKTIYENMNINKEIEIILKGSSEIPVAEIISMEKWN